MVPAVVLRPVMTEVVARHIQNMITTFKLQDIFFKTPKNLCEVFCFMNSYTLCRKDMTTEENGRNGLNMSVRKQAILSNAAKEMRQRKI